MKDFSKVLRELPDNVRRWLLQECMVNGIPTQFKGIFPEIVYNFNTLDIAISEEVGHLYIEGVLLSIYDLENNKPICVPTKWQDPTPEQVKAIYEGVKEVKCLYDNSVVEVDLSTIEIDHNNDFIAESCLIGYAYLFQKGKGFALPVSWKEDDANDTDFATVEESPEEKADRINEANISKLFDEIKTLKEKVSKLEEEKKPEEQPVKEFEVRSVLIDFLDDLRDYMRESDNNIAYDDRDSFEFVDAFLSKSNEIQHAPKEIEEWDGEFRVGEMYTTKEGDVVFCTGKGYSRLCFSGIIISINDNHYHIGQLDNDWAKKCFTPYTLPNKGEVV